MTISKEKYDEYKEVTDLLVEAWNKFSKIEQRHPEHIRDFADGIHSCQRIVGTMIAGEYHPELFPNKIKRGDFNG